MDIRQISIERIFNLGDYENRKVKLVAEITEEEDVAKSILKLHKAIESCALLNEIEVQEKTYLTKKDQKCAELMRKQSIQEFQAAIQEALNG